LRTLPLIRPKAVNPNELFQPGVLSGGRAGRQNQHYQLEQKKKNYFAPELLQEITEE